MALQLNNSTKILPALQELGFESDYHKAVQKVVELMEGSIDCEGAVTFEVQTSTNRMLSVGGNARLSRHFQPRLGLMSELFAIHPMATANQLQDEHVHEFVLSDVMSLAAFREHQFFREVIGPLDTEECMAGQLFLSQHRTVWAVLYRKKVPFKNRERELFRQVLTTAHLSMNRQNGLDYMHTLSSELTRMPIDSGNAPLPLLVQDWETAPEMDQRMQRLLFEDLFPGHTPGAVLERLREIFGVTDLDGWESPLRPRWVETRVEGSKATVRVKCLPHREGTGAFLFYPPEGAGTISRQSGEGQNSTDSVLRNLTKRQNTVLYWLSEGKSNDEIAAILSISRRTVEKHLQLAFQELGVENRLAAALEYARLQKQ